MKNKLSILLFVILISMLIPSVIMANGTQLTIEVENIAFDKFGDVITVFDMFGIKNSSNEDIISTKDNPVISFKVPNDAEQINVTMPGSEQVDFEVINKQVNIYQELPADRRMEFSISYTLNASKNNLNISLERDYPIKILNMYTSVQSGIIIDSTQIFDSGIMNIDQQSFNFYAFNNSEGSQTIDFKLMINEVNEAGGGTVNRVKDGYDGFHNPGHIRFWENSPLSKFNPHLVTIVFIVLIVFSVVYYFYKWHIDEKKNVESNNDDAIFMRLYKEESLLKKKLAELQLALDDEKISEEEYNKRYDIYKKKLVNVKLKIKEFTE